MLDCFSSLLFYIQINHILLVFRLSNCILLKPVSVLLLSPNCLISSFFFVNLYNLNFFSQFASF